MAKARLRPQSPKIRPIIAFLTDFGLADSYAAEMKAAVLRHLRDAILIDISHTVPRHDILCGSIALQRAISGFPPGTVHVAVVDPGVGTCRRLLLAQIQHQIVLCPDNGLITWPHRTLGGKYRELVWRPARSSNTFHGRDILAPAAALIAAGKSPGSVSRPIQDPVLLSVAPAESGASRGEIIQIDRFGNATTNVDGKLLAARRIKSICVRNRDVGIVRNAYGEVSPGRALALIGSSGLLEIAVRDGSAAEVLRLRVGDTIFIR